MNEFELFTLHSSFFLLSRLWFQSALDPYSHTKIFLSFENDHVGVEEGYIYWIGLPGHMRLDLGKYRQQFGELNRWHLHAVPETEYPLALTSYFGADGLAGTGLSLYRAFGGFGTHELTLQVTGSESDAELFGNSGRITYLDMGGQFVAPDGTISSSLMFDYAHPTLAGYQIYTHAIWQPLMAALN